MNSRLGSLWSRAPRSARGFSLVEITLAMGIAAVAMVAILGMLPQALKASRASSDRTAIGAVLEDIHDRIEGHVLEEGPLPSSPFFYDEQGRFWKGDSSEEEGGGEEIALIQVSPEKFFRVEVELVRPRQLQAEEANAVPDSLLAAKLSVSWPLDAEGVPVGTGNPKMILTYPVTTLTGPDWEIIEPEFQPKVEY